MRLHFLVPLMLLGNLSAAENLKQVEGRLSVEDTHGSVEDLTVRWTGAVLADRRETGGPASPLQGKFTDDRQCHWVVRTVVSRRLFLKSRGGEEFERPDTKVLEPGKEDATGFRTESYRPQNCSEAEAGIKHDIDVARAQAATALSRVVEKDLDSLKAQMKERPGVRKVRFEWVGERP